MPYNSRPGAFKHVYSDNNSSFYGCVTIFN